MAKERIDKLLSHEGFGSRKEIKRLLRTSEVKVNGKQIFDPGFLLDSNTDAILIDGEAVELHHELYLMMNKLAGTVSSTKEGNHQTVFDLLAPELRTPYLQEKLHLVGRLDLDTEGQLLLTTDGALTHRITSPKTHMNKTYLCILEKPEPKGRQEELTGLFKNGIHIAADDNDPEADCAPAVITWPEKESITPWLESSTWHYEETSLEGAAAILTIHEGRYHQVKRMFSAVGNRVAFLKRIRTGALELDKTLLPGQYRILSLEELELLN